MIIVYDRKINLKYCPVEGLGVWTIQSAWHMIHNVANHWLAEWMSEWVNQKYDMKLLKLINHSFDPNQGARFGQVDESWNPVNTRLSVWTSFKLWG